MLVCWTTASPVSAADDVDPNLGIIPAPVSVKRSPGEFVFTADTPIEAPASQPAARYLTDYLRSEYEFANHATGANTSGRKIVLTGVDSQNLPPEGYRLSITSDRVTIT